MQIWTNKMALAHYSRYIDLRALVDTDAPDLDIPEVGFGITFVIDDDACLIHSDCILFSFYIRKFEICKL